MAPDDPAINVAWGELFLEKYNGADAVRSFQTALRADGDSVAARIGLARATREQDPAAAKVSAERALEVNPNYVPALLLIAELALDERQRDDARASIQQALAVNPNSLEARALDVAIAFLEARADDVDAGVAAALALNPVYGDVHRVAGDHAARNYRFDEAVALTRRALEVDPTSTRASADLGMHLLRTGDEAGARRALEAAFEADPFDVVTFNLLAMLDTVDTFETFRDGDLIVRLHPDEADVMREHVIPLARESLETLSERYQFRPTGPILIEMFSEARRLCGPHDWTPGVYRCAGCLLRACRHARFADRATTGYVQLDSHALARDGARHDAADVQQPIAAVVVGGHLRLRGAARQTRVGTGDGSALCAGARRRPAAQAA